MTDIETNYRGKSHKKKVRRKGKKGNDTDTKNVMKGKMLKTEEKRT